MRKIVWLIIILISSAFILSACGNDTEKDQAEDKKEVEKETAKDDKAEKEKEKDESEPSHLDEFGSSGKSDREDQLYLGVGDTGAFDTVLGDFEITLHRAELIGPEFEGQESELDTYLLLELTVKNIGEESREAQDFMQGIVVTDALDQSGDPDFAFMFDSLKEIEGMLAPGEEISGDFFVETFDADTYYLERSPGNVSAGGSNQVIWTINEEDLDKTE